MDIFIGIDPSINSTGVCVLVYDGDDIVKEDFFIIKPPNKLTKKEVKVSEKILNFDILLYDSEDLSIYEDNHFKEYYKTTNMINAVDKIYEIITKTHILSVDASIHVVIEGISYGSSLKTKSIFDLAGLNYMIRQRLLRNKDLYITIAPPSQIKKFATGNGNCPKEAIIELFKVSHKEYSLLPKLDDIADAYYMAKYAKKIYELNNNDTN